MDLHTTGAHFLRTNLALAVTQKLRFQQMTFLVPWRFGELDVAQLGARDGAVMPNSQRLLTVHSVSSCKGHRSK